MMEPETRLGEWIKFSDLVRNHITKYTVPQYGEKNIDLMSGWSYLQCMESIKKYACRCDSNQREGQNILDLYKICHCACIAYWKFLNEEEEKKSFTKDTIYITMKEKQKIWETIGLLNSMVEGGERHSKQSKDMIDEVLSLFGG